MKDKLLIFTKNPILGTAKTRIGNVKGDETALKVYKKLLKYTRDTVNDLTVEKVVYFNKFIEEGDIWSNGNFTKKLQVSGDLGQKMSTAIRNEFEDNSDRVVIIGSDCAELTRSDLVDAFEKLRSTDVVIGPAKDGGYYLLGMNQFYANIFAGKSWSQESLLQETIAQCEKDGLSYNVMSEKSDIDYWDDWEQLGWTLD